LLIASASFAAGPNIRIDRIRADVAFLSSAELRGRVALEPGGDLTARFIAAEFAKAGLKPFDGKGYLQEFELVSTVLDSEQSAVTLVREGQRESLLSGSGFQGAFKNDVSISGAAVFAGYGITAPEHGYDDYLGLDVKGKVVVIFDREPQEGDAKSVFLGTGLTVHAAARVKRLNAQAHGAVAVLVLPSEKSTSASSPPNPLRSSARLLYDELIVIPQLTLTQAGADKVMPDRIRVQDEIDRTVRPQSKALPFAVDIRLSHKSRTAGKTYNVIGMLEGSDPKLRREAIVLDAHYDHLPNRDERVYPGANDNASGTAALLELARVFAASGKRPKRSLVFIGFGAEENSLLGAYVFVSRPAVPMADTKAVINMDMIGRDEAHVPQTEGRLNVKTDTRNVLNLVGTPYSPDLASALERVNRTVGLELDSKPDRDSSQNTLWRCDHFPFLLVKVPAVWLFGGWHPGYHEPSDTIEKLNFDKIEKVTRLAYLVALDLANTPKPPRFGVKQDHSQ
jgi:hypothetical protein